MLQDKVTFSRRRAVVLQHGVFVTHAARGSPVAQGILLAILVGTGAIASAEDAGNVQNLLICLEMLPASIAMFFAFPHSEYLEGGAWACDPCRNKHLQCRPALRSSILSVHA